jgi:hypothetical protein
MSNFNGANLATTLTLGERELAAFLDATVDLLGTEGRSLAADTWLRTMKSSIWPDDNLPNFFRSVSIRAISEIVVASLANKIVFQSRNESVARSFQQ